MIRTLLASTAVAILATSAAQAETRYKYDVVGQITIAGFALDQNDDNVFGAAPIDEFNGAGRAELVLTGQMLFESGLELGARVELETASDLATGEDNDALDEAYVFLDSGYGEFQVGLQDGAAVQVGLSIPGVARGMRIDNPQFFPVRNADDSPFEPFGLRLRTGVTTSGDNLKFVYLSPRIGGLRGAVSYTPSFDEDFSGVFGDDDPVFNRQSDIWEFGLNYTGSAGEIEFALSAVYLVGDNEMPLFFTGDIEELGLAALVAWERVTVGAAYRQSNATGGSLNDSGQGSVIDGENDLARFWSVGATYDLRAWTFGVSYIRGETDLLAFFGDPTQDGAAWDAAVGYNFAPGIVGVVGYQNYDYDFDTFGSPSLDADIVFLEADITL